MQENNFISKDEFPKLFDQRFKNEFGKKAIGDTPTDALQLTNKRYFITGGPGSVLGYSSVLTVDPNKGRLFTITTTSSVATINVNASVVGLYGQQLQVMIQNDGNGSRKVVFNQNFRAQSVTGVASLISVVSFTSNASVFVETARTIGV